MKFLKKLFLLPTPVELGKSEHNALPSEMFPNETDEKEYCWEDYDREMQEAHPVLWFLNRTIPRFLRRYVWGTYAPLVRAHYWLVSHTIRKYHLLDLRQSENSAWNYRYGWLDSDRQILYANFAILKNYVEKELENEFPENDPDPGWAKHYKEIKALYNYWMVDRPAWENKLAQMSHVASIVRNDQRNFKKGDRLYQELRNEQDKFDEFETKALIRLIKTRKGMWT